MKLNKRKVPNETKAFEEASSRLPVAGRYLLSLFVSGSSPRSIRAIQNIRRLCDEKLQGCYELKVIDIYQHPEQVVQEQIIVTPTLIKKRPVPLRMLIGDLSNEDRLISALGLAATKIAY
jgi:circadian clock protein KaiB